METREPVAVPVTVRNPSPQLVRVVDVDISFSQLVSLFVKAAIALIPAAIILVAIGFAIAAGLAAIVSGTR